MTTKRSSVQDISSWIRGQIRELQPGDQLDSIRNLADRAGSSPLTVSRAIAALADEGEVVTYPGKGTFVAGPHTGTNTSTGSIGLLINAPRTDKLHDSPLFTLTLPAVQFVLFHADEQSAMLHAGSYDSESEDFLQPNQIAAMDVKGVMIFGITDLAYYMRLSNEIPNLVALDVDTSNLGVPCVAFDQMQSAIDLVGELKKRKRKHIHFIGGPFPAPRKKPRWYYDSCSQERYDGWRAAMRMHGYNNIEAHTHFVGWRTGDHYQSIVHELLDLNIPLDAIVCESPNAVCKILEERGVSAKDVTVAGWQPQSAVNPGQELNDKSEVLIAELDFNQLGTLGAEMMLRLLNDSKTACERQLVTATIRSHTRQALIDN